MTAMRITTLIFMIFCVAGCYEVSGTPTDPLPVTIALKTPGSNPNYTNTLEPQFTGTKPPQKGVHIWINRDHTLQSSNWEIPVDAATTFEFPSDKQSCAHELHIIAQAYTEDDHKTQSDVGTPVLFDFHVLDELPPFSFVDNLVIPLELHGVPNFTDDTKPTIQVHVDDHTLFNNIKISITGPINYQEQGTATFTDKSFKFDIPADKELKTEGVYTVTATATDIAGNTGSIHGNFTLIKRDPPAQPTIDLPDADAKSFHLHSVIKGKKPQNTSIWISVTETTTSPSPPSPISIPLPPTPLDTWESSIPRIQLGKSYKVDVTAFDNAGNSSPSSSVTVTVISKPDLSVSFDNPSIPTPANGIPSYTNQKTVNVTGTFGPDVMSIKLTVQHDTHDTSTEVHCDNLDKAVGRKWKCSLTLPADAADGEYTLTVKASTGDDSLTNTTVIHLLTAKLDEKQKPTITTPQNSTSLKPSISGKKSAHTNILLLLNSTKQQSFLITNFTEQTEWSFTPSTELSYGEITVEAAAVDLAGNQSPTSERTTFYIQKPSEDEKPSVPLQQVWIIFVGAIVIFGLMGMVWLCRRCKTGTFRRLRETDDELARFDMERGYPAHQGDDDL